MLAVVVMIIVAQREHGREIERPLLVSDGRVLGPTAICSKREKGHRRIARS